MPAPEIEDSWLCILNTPRPQNKIRGKQEEGKLGFIIHEDLPIGTFYNSCFQGRFCRMNINPFSGLQGYPCATPLKLPSLVFWSSFLTNQSHTVFCLDVLLPWVQLVWCKHVFSLISPVRLPIPAPIFAQYSSFQEIIVKYIHMYMCCRSKESSVNHFISPCSQADTNSSTFSLLKSFILLLL